MSSGIQTVRRGTVVGTGAAKDVKTVGFRPGYVKVFNRTSRLSLEWNETMPDASAIKKIADGTTTYITSAGITPLASGFQIGTDATNGSGEVLQWEAQE